MLVIDGNSILNRAYYGIRPLTNKNGLYTHAVYGMITIISRHIETLKPDHCIVAFDLKAPTFRHKMYDGYKANRKGMPEELAVQLPYAKKCMSCLGFAVITKEGYEADDILGTAARKAAQNGIHAYVLTGDRDSLQLIDEGISVLLVKTKETIEFTREVFFENYGIQPEQFVDVKALMGDSSDNIPGVAGIGEKTALKLIAEFGSIDGLYEKYQSSKLSEGVKNKLSEGRDMAYLSRSLALIETNAPVDCSPELCEYKGPDKQALYDLFAELEFSALIKKFGLEGMSATKTDADENGKKEISCECPSLDKGEAVVALDGESLEIFDGCKVKTVSLDDVNALKILSEISIICHDYKSLYKALCQKGIAVGKCAFDTMLAAYVLNSGRGKYTLDDIMLAYLGTSDKSGGAANAVFELYSKLKELINTEDEQNLLYGVEIPLSRVLADMELSGFKIDVDGIIAYGEELGETAEALKERIYTLAGEEFNVNSPKQLGEVLFEKLGLPSAKKTKTGYSTDAETLQKLVSKHEIVEDILYYRQVAKLKSTYADALAKAADGEGRIHSLFNQTGTATGRLSSAEPNLQNIPIRTELGRRFRKYFIPKNNDYVLIDADYSQIELRLLAHISGDENMISAFASGTDIHTATAATVFGVDTDMVTPELRKRAKAVNFGIVYGIGEHSLSEDLGVSRAEARRYIDSYLASFPKVSEYLDNIKQKAREDGYVVTEFGRKRYIPELSASNKNVQHFGERVAMNSPIQGTAADIIKIAMIKVASELESSGIDARLILQVHDELLVEAHRDCAEQAMKILVECMEKTVNYAVSLDVEANIGDNWYDAK
ncbi:MAG: DNA polymerase I [Ruminococcaceae bacterium]|nr:DNA polymerase I [Oscillospiraceae bacterium]